MMEIKHLRIELSENCYRRLLDPQTESFGLKSGCVVLSSGERVGLHNTSQKEEIIFVLEGTGIFHAEKSQKIPIEKNSFIYCPPNTEHDVENTGSIPLRYIFVVTPLHNPLIEADKL